MILTFEWMIYSENTARRHRESTTRLTSSVLYITICFSQLDTLLLVYLARENLASYKKGSFGWKWGDFANGK